MSVDTRGQTPASKRVLARKLDAAGWGVFFVWVGIAFLASVGWGVGLLGVGLITLGGQLARKYLHLPVERFSLVIGAMFLAAGLWELLHLGRAVLPSALVPISFLIAGALLLLSALVRRPADRDVR